MHNLVYLIGRLTSDPIITTTEGGKDFGNITLAVTRSYKNEEGKYDIDFIDCILWNGIAQNTAEYCKKGDLVGIKGRLENTVIKNVDGKPIKTITQVVVDKISFLCSKNSE